MTTLAGYRTASCSRASGRYPPPPLTPKQIPFSSVIEADFRARALNIRRPGRAPPTKPGPWLMLGARARQVCPLEQQAQSLVAVMNDRTNLKYTNVYHDCLGVNNPLRAPLSRHVSRCSSSSSSSVPPLWDIAADSGGARESLLRRRVAYGVHPRYPEIVETPRAPRHVISLISRYQLAHPSILSSLSLSLSPAAPPTHC